MSQIQTWAYSDSENVSILWLRGWDENHFKLDGRDLYVPCKEEYAKILEKTILGTKFILSEFDFDILIRSNVSTYFDLKSLERELSRRQYRTDFYGGYVDKTKGSYFGGSTSQEYLSGTGIFMSRRYSEILSLLNWRDFENIPDDVAISEFFRQKGLRRFRMKRNNLSSTHIFLPNFYTRTKSSTDSSLAGKRMHLLRQYFETQGIRKRIRIYFLIQILELKAFFNHPEPIRMYILRNRVVAANYVKIKLGWFLR
jgi:hypothetical protein